MRRLLKLIVPPLFSVPQLAVTRIRGSALRRHRTHISSGVRPPVAPQHPRTAASIDWWSPARVAATRVPCLRLAATTIRTQWTERRWLPKRRQSTHTSTLRGTLPCRTMDETLLLLFRCAVLIRLLAWLLFFWVIPRELSRSSRTGRFSLLILFSLDVFLFILNSICSCSCCAPCWCDDDPPCSHFLVINISWSWAISWVFKRIGNYKLGGYNSFSTFTVIIKGLCFLHPNC